MPFAYEHPAHAKERYNVIYVLDSDPSVYEECVAAARASHAAVKGKEGQRRWRGGANVQAVLIRVFGFDATDDVIAECGHVPPRLALHPQPLAAYGCAVVAQRATA